MTMRHHVRRLEALIDGSVEDASGTIAVMLRVLPPARVVVLDPDSTWRRQLAFSLTESNVNIEEAASGHEMLARVAAEMSTIAFINATPPDISVGDLIRALRESPSGSKLYVLVRTTGETSEECNAALDAGADDVVAPGIPLRQLLARLAGARRIAELECSLRAALTESYKLSTTDELTRVANRRFFASNFERELARASRTARPVSLVLCDVDRFKTVNDTYGHAAGDEVLRQFCDRCLQSLRRGEDWMARLGGEEFAILLPELGPAQAEEMAERLRSAVRGRTFRVAEHDITVTASFGVCGLDEEQVRQASPEIGQLLFSAADEALYRSKRAGRDRVTRADLTLGQRASSNS